MTTEDWARGYFPHSQPAELISAPLLVQLSETEWVNPKHVVTVQFYARDHMTSALDPRVVIVTSNGNHVIRDRSLAEVVALLNGEAE